MAGTKYIEGSLNVTGSVTSTSNPLEVTANRVTSVSAFSDDNHYPTAKAVNSAITTAINGIPAFMFYKGTVGDNATITWANLPAAATTNSGHTYKVITAHTADTKCAACKVGDTIISNGSTWNVIPSGDDVEDTWRNIKVNGTEFLGTGLSTGAVNFVNGTNVTITTETVSGSKNIKISSSDQYTGTITKVKTTAGAHTAIDVSSGAATFNIPTKTSHLTNDSGFVTSSGVTKITAGTGLNTTSNDTTTDGGNITSTGTLYLTKSGVTAGTYQGLTIDKYGRVTAASNQGYLTSEVDTLGTVLNRGNTATTDINFNNKDWYNAGVQKTAYDYNTNQNPATQYWWYKITPPASNASDRYFIAVEGDVNYPRGRGNYILDVSNYNNGTSYNVSLTNLGSTNNSDGHLLAVAIDGNGNVYVQANAAWTSYLRFIRHGAATTQAYTQVGKAAFGTASGFTSLKMIKDAGCIRLNAGSIDNTASNTGQAQVFADVFIENGTKLSSKYLTTHPTITLSSNSTSTPAKLSYNGTFTAITSITQDANGHVTKFNTATYTLPADSNTNYYHTRVYSSGLKVSTGTGVSDMYIPDASTTQKGVTQYTAANLNTWINQLSTGDSVPVDADYFISQYVGGGTSTTTFHRRPVSKIFDYVKGKLSISSSNNTAQWGSAVVVGTVGGTELKFTMPNNPDNNTAHSHSAGVGLTGSGTAGTSGTYSYKVNLVNETAASNAATYEAGGTSKFYAVQLDKNNKLGVYVPWTDTDTNTHNSHKINSGLKSDGTTDIMSASASSGDITLGDSGVTAGAYGDSTAQTPNYGATFKVPSISVNAKGIVTDIGEHTVQIPGNEASSNRELVTYTSGGSYTIQNTKDYLFTETVSGALNLTCEFTSNFNSVYHIFLYVGESVPTVTLDTTVSGGKPIFLTDYTLSNLSVLSCYEITIMGRFVYIYKLTYPMFNFSKNYVIRFPNTITSYDAYQSFTPTPTMTSGGKSVSTAVYMNQDFEVTIPTSKPYTFTTAVFKSSDGNTTLYSVPSRILSDNPRSFVIPKSVISNDINQDFIMNLGFVLDTYTLTIQCQGDSVPRSQLTGHLYGYSITRSRWVELTNFSLSTASTTVTAIYYAYYKLEISGLTEGTDYTKTITTSNLTTTTAYESAVYYNGNNTGTNASITIAITEVSAQA